MTLKEMAHAVHLGASLESVAPADADIPYLRRIVQRYIDKYITGKVKPRRKYYRRSGRTNKHSNYAAQVVAGYNATAELVERANCEDDPVWWRQANVGGVTEVKFALSRRSRQMKVWCAWHPLYFGCEKLIRETDDNSDLDDHGMCKDCQEKWLEQDKERMKERTMDKKLIELKARNAGATHRDSINPNVFYQKDQYETRRAVYNDITKQFGSWRYHNTNPPESAEVL